ncbi:M24 family metallopeptidase [Actinocrispum wychmicini]|uniref:Xaa-Pro aminopeptidase n=1 Tax=Actinocrispum wychmicini TaxID=1213861 RepID=A0A4R2JLV3_9PSEU|nr:M24 family metallopeptidase [Actinocrispum wychmicini]TCO59582.1 Xaa-Pro aminopeptidase [Actinocrispum wychmicini]
MIATDVLERRLATLRRRAEADGLDAVVVVGAPACLGPVADSPGNVRFLTGWMALYSPAVVVVPCDDQAVVIAVGPHDTRGFASRAGDIFDVRRIAGGPAPFAEAISDVLGTTRRVGVAGLSELANPLASVVPSGVAYDGVLHELRLNHYGEFIGLAETVAAISDAMVEAVLTAAAERPCTGADLMTLTEQVGRSLGADYARCWLATGTRPETTYFELTELRAEVAEGHRVQIGTTVAYEGFFGQSLRMGVIGEPTALLAEHAARLTEIQDVAARLMKPGVSLRDFARRITDMVDDACPYDGTDPFRFQLCHGLGLSYSEPGMRGVSGVAQVDPRFADVVFAQDMVIEVHPNYSVPGLGHVCAGDMARVTAAGGVWLTRSARGLRSLAVPQPTSRRA